MCLEEQGYGGSGNIRQLSEPDFRGSRRLMPAVVSKLGAAITNFLQDGQSVDIPHLGIFNLTANSTGVKTLDEAKASQIKSINLRFSSKEEADLALSRCTLTRSVLMTNTNDVIKEKDPNGEIVDDPTA